MRATIVGLPLAALLLFLSFVAERLAKEPMLPRDLFRVNQRLHFSRAYVTCMAVTAKRLKEERVEVHGPVWQVALRASRAPGP